MGIEITLEACRVNKGMTQKQVSKMLGISNNTYSMWEQYKTPLKAYQIEKLSEIFEIPIENIFCLIILF